LGVSAGAAPGQAAGGSLPALTVLGGTNNLVSVDALEEFRVQTNGYAPEFGRTSGAQVALVTRSGTNELRGSAFNYFRHEALDANDWFANSRGLARPRIRQHDLGGTLGGPLKEGKAFFFLSHESLRLRQPRVAVTEVPSLAARLAAPASLRPLLEAFPRPNGAETGGGLAEFTAAFSDPSRVDATSLRVDFVSGDKLTLFARYGFSPSETEQRGAVVRPAFGSGGVVNPTSALSLNTLTRTALDTRMLTLGANYAPRAGLVNELRAGWGRARGESSFALDDFGGANVLPFSLLLPSGASDAGFQLVIQGGTNSNLAAGEHVSNLQRQLNVADNLSVVRGSHQLRFGADYRRLAPVYNSLRYGQSVVYGGVGRPGETQTTGTVLSGRARSVQVFAGAGARFPVFTNFSAYAQDTWRATRRLTLTYGLRWELNPPPRESRGQHALTLADADAPPAQLALAPSGTPLWRTTFDNFAPRVGFAYLLDADPGSELVLRGGAGIFYDLGTGQAAQGFGNVAPFVAVRTINDAAFPLPPDLSSPPPLSDQPPFDSLVAFDPRLELPRTYQWNVAVARSLGTGQTVTAAYVGALGRDLLREDAFVRPNQNFNLVRLTRNAAASDYHALQVQFARRLARRLQALASYTFARSTDDASSDALSRLRVSGSVVGPGGAPFDVSTGRGPSDFDVRHSLTAAATYALPRLASGATLAPLVRGWSVSALLRARTATPVNVVTQADVLGDGLFVELRRPDIVSGVPVYVEDPQAPGGRRLNRAAFRVPLENRQGTLGYNALRGFPLVQLDSALRRQFALNERLRLDLRAEVFNLLNQPNFGNPVANLSSNLFGLSTQTFARSLGSGGAAGGLSPIYQVGGPRSVQLALKLHF
ncbi:MAG TPA: hypothetical protein VGV38_16255, partial [Pyrinomonadaceae bacterium]|nr:hypothetical protein [Pyrinomonadaceae bacterium]